MKWSSNWKSSTVNCIDEVYRKIAFKLNARFPINELESFSNRVTKPPGHPQLIPDHEKRFSQSNSFSKMQFCEIQFNRWKCMLARRLQYPQAKRALFAPPHHHRRPSKSSSLVGCGFDNVGNIKMLCTLLCRQVLASC